MTARIARNNGNATEGPDYNGDPIPPGAIRVVDDEAAPIIEAVASGTLELDPTLGRHYTAGPTERRIRPTDPQLPGGPQR